MCPQDFYYIAGGLSALLASVTYCVKVYQNIISKELGLSRKLQSEILPLINRLDYNVSGIRTHLERDYMLFVVRKISRERNITETTIIKAINGSNSAIKNITSASKVYAYQNILRNLNLWSALLNKHIILRYLSKSDNRNYFVNIINSHYDVIRALSSVYNSKSNKLSQLIKLYKNWK